MSNGKLRIDLGCGQNKKEGYLGVDILPLPGVDYIIDIENGFDFLDDNSVDEYYSSHFLEHINNLEFVLNEVHRTLKKEGIFKVIVPHFTNPYYYSDYTHKRFFGFYSFDYFSELRGKRIRSVPKYTKKFQFEVLAIKLIFKSPSKFFLLNHFRKHIIQRLFNISPYFQELYEGVFSKIISCSELHFTLRPVKE